MRSVPLPGVAVGVVHGDELVYGAGFGVADRQSQRRVTVHTLFQIGSVTKSFTATLVGILVDEGRLDFDGVVTKYLPSTLTLPAVLQPERITLRQLAGHRSGLPAQPSVDGRVIDSELVLSFTHFELYQSLRSATPSGPPGDKFEYSNLGYGLLGHILELTTDRPFEILLRERLFEPLGMKESTITLRLEHQPRLATPYHLRPNSKTLEESLPADMEALAPAGGISSTVHDLAKYVSLHTRGGVQEGRIITQPTLEALHETSWSFSDRLGYGLGWGTARLPGIDPVVFHDGRVAGYTTYISFTRESRIGVIVLTNVGGDPTPRPIRELGHEILGIASRALRE